NPGGPPADAGEAALGEQRVELADAEHARPADPPGELVERPERLQVAAAAREEREPPAGLEHARHVVERLLGVAEEVEGGEAADGVEALVPEREPDRVAADVGDVRLAGVRHRAA